MFIGTHVIIFSAAFAHDTWGHKLMEAYAYRQLMNHHENLSPLSINGSELLNELIKNRVLDPPKDLKNINDSSAAALQDTSIVPFEFLLPLKSGFSDVSLPKQFAKNGQQVHFMAMKKDLTDIPTNDPAAAKHLVLSRAFPKCIRYMTELVYQILLSQSGAEERQETIYDLMHVIQDSFSQAHAERDTATLQISCVNIFGSGDLPEENLHAGVDPRDHQFLKSDLISFGNKELTYDEINPYLIPEDSLTATTRITSEAVIELLKTIYMMLPYRETVRQRYESGNYQPAGMDSLWRDYLRRYFPSSDETLNHEVFDDLVLRFQPEEEQSWGADGSIGLSLGYIQKQPYFGINYSRVLSQARTPVPLSLRTNFGYARSKNDYTYHVILDLFGSGFNIPLSDMITVGCYLTTFDMVYQKGDKFSANAYIIPKVDVNFNDRISLTAESWLYTYQNSTWNSSFMLSLGMILKPSDQLPSPTLAQSGLRSLSYETMAKRNKEETVDYRILYGYEYNREHHTGYMTIPFLNHLLITSPKLKKNSFQYGAWSKFIFPTKTGTFELHIQSKSQLRYGVGSWSHFDFGVELESIGFDARLSPDQDVKLLTDQLGGIVIRFLFYDITLQPVKYSFNKKSWSISPMGIRVAVESPF